MDTRETIELDVHAQHRLLVLTHLLAGELTLVAAAEALELSTRQLRRVVERFRSEGAQALVHGNRGRPPANRIDGRTRERILELASGEFAGFNPVHLAECLAELAEPIEVSPRSLRRILAEGGLRSVRTRRRRRHERRERMAAAGMLLQADGSDEAWLGERGPRLTLVAGIDDATNLVTGASFRVAEDAAGYFAMLTETVRAHGLPVALYTDRHGIFEKRRTAPPTLAEQLAGQRSLTQVGRALDEAGIAWIGASSPEAKGRIERLWGTLHDRLVAELRRARIDSLEAANAFLAWYLPRHNARFAVPPASEAPAWRPWPLEVAPEAVFCFQYRRRIEADGTINWDGASLALPRRSDGRAWGRRAILVEERLDGSLWARIDGREHELAAAPPTAPQLRARDAERRLTERLERPPEPQRLADVLPALSAAEAARRKAQHPWRRYPAIRPR